MLITLTLILSHQGRGNFLYSLSDFLHEAGNRESLS